MNIKKAQIHSYQLLNLKTKTKLSKQLEQEQNQRNGHHMEGFQGGRGGIGGKRYREEEA